jgi:hypothetical protein
MAMPSRPVDPRMSMLLPPRSSNMGPVEEAPETTGLGPTMI